MKTIKIKMPANVKYELVGTGYIKAESILKVLLEQPNITLLIKNVIPRIDNLLIDDMYIVEKARYDCLTNNVELDLVERKV